MVERRKNISTNLKLCMSANVYSTHALSSKELKPGSVTEPLGAEPGYGWVLVLPIILKEL